MSAPPTKRKAPPSRQEHACTVCGAVYSRSEYVRRHYRNQHADELYTYTAASSEPRPDGPPRPPDPVPVKPTSSRSRPPRCEGAAPASPASASPSGASASTSSREGVSELAEQADSASCGSRPAPGRSVTSAIDISTLPPRGRPTSSLDIFAMFAPSPSTCYALPTPPPIAVAEPESSPPTSTADHAAAAFSTLSPSTRAPHDESPATPFLVHDVPPAAETLAARVDVAHRRDLPQVAPVRAQDVLALAALRPRHFAVQVLPGSEEDWIEAEEDWSAADGEQGDFERMVALVTGSAMGREPSMYPGKDHLFALERNTSSRFFMPAQLFCIAYLYPFELPPLPKLSRYAAQTYDSLLPILPVLHRPSLDLKTIAPPLAFALSVVGAGLFESSKPFHNEMTHIKREFAAAELTHVVLHEDERLAAAQTLLLYQLVGCFSDSQAERDYSRRHHGLLIQTLLDMVPPPEHAVPLDLDLPADDLERVWREWIAYETHVRIAYLCYLLDLEVGRASGDEHRLLPHSHSAISTLPLPSSDALWNAESASTWCDALTRARRRQYGRNAPPTSPPTFKSVLNALLCSSPPPQGSSGAQALASLTHVAPLAITVLFQTLEGLRRQITLSQRLLVNLAAAPPTSLAPSELLPGSSALGIQGGILEAAATSAQESQVRIAFGLKVLRMFGGTAASQQWFAGVQAIFR